MVEIKAAGLRIMPPEVLAETYKKLVSAGTIVPKPEVPPPTIPMDYKFLEDVRDRHTGVEELLTTLVRDGRDKGGRLADHVEDLPEVLAETYKKLVSAGTIVPKPEVPPPTIPMVGGTMKPAARMALFLASAVSRSELAIEPAWPN
jgi:hypothetical protein